MLPVAASWFPCELVQAQRQVWACEAATRAFVLAGPDQPVVHWPLPRQAEYRRLRNAQRQAQREVETHPLMASAIAEHRWSVTVRALWRAAREESPREESPREGAACPARAAA